MASIDWPTYARMPLRQAVSPIEEVVANQALRHPYKEVMHVHTLWHAHCHWNAMVMNSFLGTKAHLIRGRGGERWFKLPILEARRERGSKSGNVTFSGAHAVNATSWGVSGGTGQFLAGDWVMVDAATNVPYAYMVTSSESGGTIEVWPKLRAATTGATRIYHMGDVPEIYDTMELATPEPIFGDVEIASPLPLYSNPFDLEFVTAVRRSP